MSTTISIQSDTPLEEIAAQLLAQNNAHLALTEIEPGIWNVEIVKNDPEQSRLKLQTCVEAKTHEEALQKAHLLIFIVGMKPDASAPTGTRLH